MSYENQIVNEYDVSRPNGTGEDSEDDPVETGMTQVGVAESISGRSLAEYTVTAVPATLPYAQAPFDMPSAEALSRLTYDQAVKVINDYTFAVFGFYHPLLLKEQEMAEAGVDLDGIAEDVAKAYYVVSDRYAKTTQVGTASPFFGVARAKSKERSASRPRKTESPPRTKNSKTPRQAKQK